MLLGISGVNNHWIYRNIAKSLIIGTIISHYITFVKHILLFIYLSGCIGVPDKPDIPDTIFK